MHKAVVENPGYIEMLKHLGEVSENIVAPPLTEEEIAVWQNDWVTSVSQDKLFQARDALVSSSNFLQHSV